ncbi:MAG: peptidylprolyl isomerase [bacterium]|nr:peptidylprolyl isomerase [bacterium]
MMNPIFRSLLPAVLLVLPATIHSATAEATVARIGDRTISISEFEHRAGELLRSGYKHLDTLGMDARLQLLDGVIAQELLVLEGQQRGVGDDPVIAMDLARTERRALMNALYDSQALLGDYSSTEQELREYSVTAQYDSEVLSRHIVCDTEAEALTVLAALKAGTTFETLVATHSRRSIQDRFGPGGWVGWFRIGELYDELQEPLKTMTPGEIYPRPVKTSLGYHVFGLQARRPTSFEESLPFLRSQLRIQKRADDMERYVNGLRERYKVQPVEQGLVALAAIDAQDSSYAGPEQSLITWKGGRLSVADFMDLVREGRTQHPARMSAATLRKEVDNQAGGKIMMTEARKLGLDRLPHVARKTTERRQELYAKWLFMDQVRQHAQPDTSAATTRRFYDENLDLFTRTDGVVTDFGQVASGIRTLLVNQEETATMDRFIADLRQRHAGDIHVNRKALQKAVVQRPK